MGGGGGGRGGEGGGEEETEYQDAIPNLCRHLIPDYTTIDLF